MNQQEKIILLKQFIEDAPASHSDHERAKGLLYGIMEDYSKKITELQRELERLKNDDKKGKDSRAAKKGS